MLPFHSTVTFLTVPLDGFNGFILLFNVTIFIKMVSSSSYMRGYMLHVNVSKRQMKPS